MSAAQRRADLRAQAALIVAALGVALVLLWPAPETDELFGRGPVAALAQSLARVTYDDGYYYLEIARHVALGAGSSFDGLNPTNGYHPLWMLLLVPIAAGAPDPSLRLVLTGLLQLALTLGGLLVAWRAARDELGPGAALLAVLAWLQYAFTYRATLSGLEFALQALVLFACARLHARAWRAGGLSPRDALRLGLLLAVLFLARLETLAFGLLVGGAWAFRLRDSAARTPALLRLCLPLALTAGAYACLNLVLFGHVSPVSAHMKREWSLALLAADVVRLRQGRLAAELWDALWPVFNQKRSLWLYLAVGLAGPALLFARGRARAWLGALAPLALFGWLQYLGAVLLYHGGYGFQPWYYVAPAWLACLLGAQLAERLVLGRGAAGRALCAAAGVALVAFSLHTAARARAERVALGEPLLAGARWARQQVPADARIGAWNAGGTAFFSGRTVIGLDGLVNSWPYALGERFELCDYFRRKDVRYLVDAFWTPDRFGFLRQPLACLESIPPVWVGPRFAKSDGWRVEAYRLER